MIVTPESLQKSEARLTELLIPLRGSPTFDRVQLYVAKLTGGLKLSSFLTNPVFPAEDKARILDCLTSILESGDLSRLPELPALEFVKPQPAPIPRDTDGNSIMAPMVTKSLAEIPITRAEIRAIAREEARTALADLLGKLGHALGHPDEPSDDADSD